MTLSTLRPNGGSNGWGITGGATEYGVTSDNADGSYISTPSSPENGQLDFSTFTLPTGARVRSVTPRIRIAMIGGSITGALQVNLIDPALSPTGSQGNFIAPTSTITTFTLPGFTKRADGAEWTQADIDAMYLKWNGAVGSGTLRIYELYIDVLYNEAPVVSAVTPSGTITASSQPAIGWTYTDPDGDVQERYRVKVFSAAQYGIGGFDPETSPSTWDSGAVFSSAVSVYPDPLVNGTTYKAYVKAADAGSGGRYSAWAAGSAFTITLDVPAVPGFSAVTGDNTNARFALDVLGRDNLLTANQSDFETNTVGWTATSNCTIARSLAQFKHGVASLAMTSSASGNMLARTGSGVSGSPITGGLPYYAVAAFRSAISARSCQVWMYQYDSAGVYLGNDISGATVADTTTGWTYAFAEGTPAANCAYLQVEVRVIATGGASEVHYVDTIGLFPGYFNLLTYPGWNARLETTTNLTGDNATLSLANTSNSSITPVFGQNCVALTGTNGSDLGVYWPTVVASSGQTYTFTFWTYGLYPARGILSFAGGATTTETYVSATDGQWTRHTVTATAGVGVTGVVAKIQFQNGDAVAGKVGYVSAAQLARASVATPFQADIWTVGGLLTLQRFTIQRSIDELNWETVTRSYPYDLRSVDINDQYESITVYDYEAGLGTPIYYRIQAMITTGGNTLASDWSPAYLGTALSTSDCFWIKDPDDPTRNMSVILNQHQLELTRTESMGVHFALGRPDPLIVHGTVHYPSFPLSLWFSNDTDYYAWKTMQDGQRTLLLQTNYGDGGEPSDSIYFVLLEQVVDAYLTTDDMRIAQWRLVSFTAQQTAAPI